MSALNNPEDYWTILCAKEIKPSVFAQYKDNNLVGCTHMNVIANQKNIYLLINLLKTNKWMSTILGDF